MLDEHAQVLHDLFAEDLDLPLLIDVLVRVENQCHLRSHESLELVLLKVIFGQLKLSVSRHVVLIDELDVAFAIVFLGLFLDLLQILFDHLSEWRILLVLCRFLIESSLLLDALHGLGCFPVPVFNSQVFWPSTDS